MNISLYSLASEYQQAAEKLADLDMPDEVIADTLEGLQFPIEQKAVNVAAFVRNLKASVSQIKEAESAMAARRKALENRAARVEQYLLDNMQRAGMSKIESPYFVLSVRDNPPSVCIDAEGLIPQEFMRQPEPPPPAPDKKAIAQAIKDGKDVPGAHLVTSKRLDIK